MLMTTLNVAFNPSTADSPALSMLDANGIRTSQPADRGTEDREFSGMKISRSRIDTALFESSGHC